MRRLGMQNRARIHAYLPPPDLPMRIPDGFPLAVYHVGAHSELHTDESTIPVAQYLAGKRHFHVERQQLRRTSMEVAFMRIILIGIEYRTEWYRLSVTLHTGAAPQHQDPNYCMDTIYVDPCPL